MLQFKPLTPLTGEDDEWCDQSEMSGGEPLWQNKRYSAVFKDGTRAYDVNNHKVDIEFPFLPENLVHDALMNIMEEEEPYPLLNQAFPPREGEGRGRRYERFRTAAQDVLDAAASDRPVYNIEYTEWKDAISRTYEQAINNWRDQYTYAGKTSGWPQSDLDPYFAVNGNFHNAPSDLKKIAKYEKASGRNQAFLALKEVIAEFMPLWEALKTLKDRGVTKGRKPAANPRLTHVNPNRIERTCPCCLRSIAVAGGLLGHMAHHGYRRPGWGEQTASCPGIRFQCLEVSDEGLKYMVKSSEQRLTQLTKALQELPDVQFLGHPRDYGSSEKPPRMIRKDELKPEDQWLWREAYDRSEHRLKSEISTVSRSLKDYQKMLAKWKPTEGPGVEQLPNPEG